MAYLLQRLDQALAPLGGSASLQTFTPDFDYNGPETVRDPYANVVGFVPGVLTAMIPGSFLLGAHLDATGANSFPWDPWNDPAPGADDNASGVAVLLEVARVMGERQLRPQADTYFVFFDGEERQGLDGSDVSLVGSRVLARTDLGRIFGVINLDMVSYNPRQDSLVVITNITSRWLANTVLDAHAGGAAPGLSLARVVKGLGNSDHASFWNEGVDGVMLIEAENIPAFQPNYHRVTDTVGNSFSRGGSQAVKAGELVLGLVESWAQTGTDALTLTDEGVLFQESVNGIRVVDAAVVDPGDSVEVVVTVVNRGGTRLTGWNVLVDLETLDGRPLRNLGTLPGSGLLPAGGGETLRFPWFPDPDQVGGVRARVQLVDPGNPANSQTATRSVNVAGGPPKLVRAYVYPNPTRSPRQATAHYELSEAGALRASVIDARGRAVASVAFPFDPVLPGPRVDVGAADVSLDDILQGTNLAPGLYFLRLEMFSAEAVSLDVSLSRFVVLQ